MKHLCLYCKQPEKSYPLRGKFLCSSCVQNFLTIGGEDLFRRLQQLRNDEIEDSRRKVEGIRLFLGNRA